MNLKKEFEKTRVLLRCIPQSVLTLFIVSVICMNLLANKTLVQLDWIALDGGILISWLSFMCMDVITKHFGPKASNKITLVAVGVNLLTCLIFFIASAIPSNADDYTAFNQIFGGTWFILLGSTVAFLASAVINNAINWVIGQSFKKNPDGKLAYSVRTYVSTLVGQFLDNFIFSIIAAHLIPAFIRQVHLHQKPLPDSPPSEAVLGPLRSAFFCKRAKGLAHKTL